MEGNTKILIVEDDPALALGLVDALEFEGFDALHALTGAEAIRLALAEKPSCLVLDLMLPDMNGYQVCEAIRQHDSAIPILILSARAQEADKIRGLDVGADDYVTKPFSIGELVARIRALLRRFHRAPAASLLQIGSWRVDLVRQTMERGGEVEQLSFHEAEVLRLLLQRAGQPASRDEILERVYGVEAQPTNRTVDNLMVKLRKRLEEQPDKPKYILTVYGIGYKLAL